MGKLENLTAATADKCRGLVLTEAGHYLTAAIAEIDKQLGRGYASEHPQLIAAFMQACAIEAVAGTLEREIRDLAETVAQAIRESA
jgi:hypothetical protein